MSSRQNLDPRAPPVAKKLFSMITPEVDERLGGMNRDQAVLMGLESHVCVFQTAMDLMARGWEVHVLVDGVQLAAADGQGGRAEATRGERRDAEHVGDGAVRPSQDGGGREFQGGVGDCEEKRPEPPLPSL